MQQHDSIQSNYWDKKAKKISNINTEMSAAAKTEIEDFFNFVGLGDNLDILEVGAGSGRFTLPLLRKGHKVTATEISAESLKELYKLAQKEKLIERLTLVETAFAEPVFENKFDAIIIGNVIHHFDPGRKKEILSNITCSLKPGGKIGIFEPNAFFPLYLPWYLFLELSGREKGIWAAEKGLFTSRAGKIKKIILEFDVNNVQIKRHTFIPLRLDNAIIPVNKINEALAKIPLINYFSAFFWIKGRKQQET